MFLTLQSAVRSPAKSIAGHFRLLAFRKLWVALALSLLLAPLSLYSIRWYEFAVTFHPEPFSASQGWKVPEGAEEVSFRNADQLLLHGWFVSSPSQPSTATVIFFHGNGGNISNVGWVGKSLAARGFDVLLFDYRGYGKSQGEMRDERDLYTDADAAYEYVVTERHVSAERVVLYGHSLGSAAVADLAVRSKCAAVILESGLSPPARWLLPCCPGSHSGCIRSDGTDSNRPKKWLMFVVRLLSYTENLTMLFQPSMGRHCLPLPTSPNG